MHEQIRRDKGLTTGKKEGVLGPGYQGIGAKAGDEKHLKITFAVIEKMHYSDFNSGNDAEDFKPSDIIDEDDANLSDDEVLKKFKNDFKLPQPPGVGTIDPFDPKQMLNAKSKDALMDESVTGQNIGLGLGLKQPNLLANKSSPRQGELLNGKNLETLKR